MQIIETAIADIKVFIPKIWGDDRGYFYESFNQQLFNQAVGREVIFVQDNHSLSKRGVLRGLHYQIQHTQGKLVRVIEGEVFDVGVDLRKNSPTFRQWVGEILSAENKKQLWIPEGFAHGFIVLSETAQFLYKTTDYYAPNYDRCIIWNDPTLAINWQFSGQPELSAKDQMGKLFVEADIFN
ncbi:MAG: dTDP-4-dehydrorhamnose 3,5-epimerase [Pseudomonadota bacterium]|jgi:dTDP-4-dehydrorhamnose 3,5-epimerase